MGNDVKETLMRIGTRILVNARNELYFSMRFLDVALSSLGLEFNLTTFYVGTDGENIYYNPRFLMERYEHQPLLINRAYLHMVLHCIFKHMYEAENREEEEWNLACDIAIEYIIDSFEYKAVARVVSDYRTEIYNKYGEKLKVLTAEGIYQILMEEKISYQEYVRLTTEFLVDDHVFWKAKRKKAPSDEAQDDSENEIQDDTENETQDDSANEAADETENDRNKDADSEKNNETNNNNNNRDENSEKYSKNDSQNNGDKNSENNSMKNSKSDSKTKSRNESKNGSKNESNNDLNKNFKNDTANDSKNNSNKGEQTPHKENQLEKKILEEKKQEQIDKWNKVSEKMKTNLETFMDNIGSEAGTLLKTLHIETRERYDYRSFLRKFAVQKEVMQVDMDAFDYGFYNYGIQTYGNMPLMEALEYKEVEKIEEFVIAIDTSASCSGDLVKSFLDQTYTILKSSESFLKKVQIHIIQCDMEIQEDIVIHSLEEFKLYQKEFTVKGFGGTDFRPVFTYVDDLINQKQIKQLKGMIYFTDGHGIYPKKRPNYDVAFIFLKDDYTDANVPSWAMKLILSSKDLS